jgi:hypothetical protein
MMIAPRNSSGSCNPATESVGPSELRSTCRNSTSRSDRPFARAVCAHSLPDADVYLGRGGELLSTAYPRSRRERNGMDPDVVLYTLNTDARTPT